MGDFNPANAQFRLHQEATAGLPPKGTSPDWHDFEITSESLTADHTKIDLASIVSGAQRRESKPSKINIGGDTNHEYVTEQHDWFLGNFQKFVDSSTLVAGVEEHIFAPSSATAMPGTYTLERSRDDDEPQLFKGGRTSGLTFSIANSTVLTSAVTHVFERVDYWDDSVISVETSVAVPSAELPILQNYPAFADWLPTTVDGDIYLKVVGVGSLPTSVDLQVKVGAAATFPAPTVDNTITVTAGLDALGRPIFESLIDANSELIIGSRDLPVQVHIPALTTGWELNDEFVIPRDRPVWTPVIPSTTAFNEIFVTINIDGVSFCINQLDLSLVRPVIPRFCIGGRFAEEVRERGQRVITGSIQREYLDTELRKRLERGVSFELDVQAFTGVLIGATTYEHSLRLFMPKCVPSGPTASVTGPDTMDETIAFDCFPDATNPTFTDDITAVVVNTIADMTL